MTDRNGNGQRMDCHVDRIEFSGDRGDAEGAETLVLRISGMGCVNCANRVHNALITQRGVLEVTVNHETGSARLVFDPDRFSTLAIVRAVAGAGDERHNYRIIA